LNSAAATRLASRVRGAGFARSVDRRRMRFFMDRDDSVWSHHSGHNLMLPQIARNGHDG
jgi:hypothetical protein